MLPSTLIQISFCFSLISDVTSYSYEIFYFKQQVDHFSFANEDSYLQRYLYNDTFWKPNVGPIFFYTGNEGDIEWFCNNTGFMWDIAPEFNAMLIFAEHRYYGNSLPYGNLSYSNSKYLGYLTSEQALADFAKLVIHIKSTTKGAKFSPVIAFGGSYGGMLAAWMRMKYPHIIQGSLAASAPILQFTNITGCKVFNDLVTLDYTIVAPECSKSIRKTWDIINKFNETESGRDFLTSTFQLCTPLKSTYDVWDLKNWLSETYSSLAMMNYPYPTNFMAPLPGWPVKEVCKHLLNSSIGEKELMQSLFNAISVYFNYTGQAKCLNISYTGTTDLGDQGWEYQECTEMVMPMCADGINDMFEPVKWDFKAFADQCFTKYKITPREFMAPLIYGGKHIRSASNIIFSNGDLDPWAGGGILNSMSDTLIAIYIIDAAHHLDLRAANPMDTKFVIKARETEKFYIKRFISTYNPNL